MNLTPIMAFLRKYIVQKSKPYIKSKYGERHIDNFDGIVDRTFILKVVEE